MTRYAVVIATCGGQEWADLAWSRAYPSAAKQRDGQGDAPQVVIEHYPELTVAAARNAAAANADRDWLVFLDADDELDDAFVCEIDCARGRLCLGSDELPESWPAAPLLVPAVQYAHQTTRGVKSDLYPRIPNQGRWPELNECVIGTAVHRGLFERVGGFRDEIEQECETCDGTGNWTGWSGDDQHTQERGCYDCAGTGRRTTPLSSLEDWDLWLRCFDAGAQLVYAPDAVYRAYVTPDGRNRDQSPYAAIWAEHLARVSA